MLGNGNGTFQAAENYATGISPVAIAVGDFNGDGKPDLAVVNASHKEVSILLGNGTGTFQAAVSGDVTNAPAGGDFKGDWQR